MAKQVKKPVDTVTAAFNLRAWPVKTCGPCPTRDQLITAAGLLGSTRRRFTGTSEQLAVAAYLRPRDDDDKGFNHPATVAVALNAVTGSTITNERRNVVQHRVTGIAKGLKLVNLISVNGAWYLELTKAGAKQVERYRQAMGLTVVQPASPAPSVPADTPIEAPVVPQPEPAEINQQAA